MFMPMYELPPFPVAMDGTAELCPSSELRRLSGAVLDPVTGQYIDSVTGLPSAPTTVWNPSQPSAAVIAATAPLQKKFDTIADQLAHAKDRVTALRLRSQLIVARNKLAHAYRNAVKKYGMSGLGDPFGITDLATAFANYSAAKNQQKIQEDQLKAQIQAQKAQQVADAQNFALTSAQAAIAPAEKARNATMYALAAVGGVAALVGTAILLAAVKGKKRK